MRLKFKSQSHGIASVPTVIALTGLIIASAVFIASITESGGFISASTADSSRALLIARSGAKDALIKITRDKDYSNTYQIEFAINGCNFPFSGCADIYVSSANNPKVIQSQGQFGKYVRKINVAVDIDSNGELSNFNWTEL